MEKEKPVHFPEIEAQFPCHPAPSLVVVLKASKHDAAGHSAVLAS